MKANPINTTRKQRILTPRKEPYWYSFRRGAGIGLYVGATKREWVARAKGPDHRYKAKTLGDISQLTYEQAEAEARKFADLTERTERPGYAIRDAVNDYVADLRVRKGARAADDAEQRLVARVPQALMDARINDVRTAQVKAWRDSMVRSAEDHSEEDVRRSRDTANRVLAIFKAALNFAFRSGIALTDVEWRRVEGFEGATEARALFLEPDEVQMLLAAATGAFRDLLQAAVLTGARYGELASAKAGDFDPKAGTLKLSGKTGSRSSYLSRDAVTFFRRVSKGKLPGAPLLMKDDGEPWGKSHQHRPMKAAVKAAGLPPETVFYSLRHYHISRALVAGVRPQVIAENCGTSVLMIERNYGKFTARDRRAMLDSIAL